MECSPVTTKILSEAVKTKLPVNGSFELTGDCVFNCRMCYVHNCSKRSLEQAAVGKEKWLPLLKQCVDEGLLLALLTGGEPLLYSDFNEIYTFLKNNGVITTINTNAYLINEEKLELFRRLPPQRFNISLYGANNEIYNKLCGVSDGFSVVDKNIKLLKKYGFNMRLNVTVTKTNKNGIYDIVKYANENGLIIRPTTYIFATAQNCFEERLSPEEAAETSVELFRLTHTEQELKGMAATMLLRQNNAKRSRPFSNSRPGIVCHAGSSSYWVHSDGKFSACGMLPVEGAPNAFECGLKECWKAAVNQAKSIKSNIICNACEYRLNCKKCYSMLACEDIKPENIESSYSCKYHKALTDEFIKAGKQYGKIYIDRKLSVKGNNE